MGRRKMLKESRAHITRDVLLDFLRAGVVLTVAVTAPGAVRAVKSLLEKEQRWERYYPSSIERHTMKLWRKGYVDMRENADGYVVILTDKGKTETLRYDIDEMSIEEPEEWDGRWRMVFFDLPAGEEKRDLFRRTLLSLGFFQMQKSVYVHPYPCRKQVQFLREVLEIPHGVKLATVDELENDDDLKRFFRL